MSEADRELNEKVARARGWTHFPYMMPDPETPTGVLVWCPPGERPHVSTIRPLPDFLNDPAAFMDLLVFHAGERRYPSVHLSRRGDEWEAAIRLTGASHAVAKERADTPARALCLATVAWKEGA